MVSDDELRAYIAAGERELRGTGPKHPGRKALAVFRELLAIRERATVMRHPSVHWVVYGGGAQAPEPERLYSEEEVEKHVADVVAYELEQYDAERDFGDIPYRTARVVLRRLRGEGEATSIIRRDAGPGGCPELCDFEPCRKAGRCQG